MQNQRDRNIYALYGQAKYSGAIEAPVFPSAGRLLQAGIGTEYATTGSTPTNSTTLSSAAAVGASTLSTATTFSVNDIIQIDSTASNKAEVRKVTAVSGAGPYTITLDPTGPTLNFAHSSGATVAKVVAPYTHYLKPSNTLSSLTVEKCVAGFQSEQFPGCRVGKLAFKSGATNTPVLMTADVSGQDPTVLGTPSVPTWQYDTPFMFAEATMSIYGTSVTTISDLSVDIDNILKPVYTHGTKHAPNFITPVAVKVSGKFKAVFESLNDTNVGYFLKTSPPGAPGATTNPNGAQGALTFTWTHTNNNYAFQVSLPQVNFKKHADTLALEDVAMEDLDFEASYSTSSLYTLQAQLTNGTYTPY